MKGLRYTLGTPHHAGFLMQFIADPKIIQRNQSHFWVTGRILRQQKKPVKYLQKIKTQRQKNRVDS